TQNVTGSVVYKHVQVNENYNTSCTFILNSMFENETLRINVTMYPDVTSKEIDRAYGKTILVYYP
ncbi:polymorphic transmembrane cluster 2 transmembrane protein 11, partial [Biomphalaria glabrata]